MSINTAFFGTSDRSIPILEALKSDPEVNLILCVTKADTKVGRHQEIRETAVKKWAKGNKVKFITVESLKKEYPQVIEQIIDSNIQLGVVADFSFIIPSELISIIKHGIINVHFSLLPKWRGASPIQAAILNGDTTTGITYLLTESGLDSGDIIHQIGYTMAGNETAGELYEKLFPIAAENLPKVLAGYLNGTLKPKKQDETQATYSYSPTHPKNTFICKEDAQIDWNKTPDEISRAVRAFNPWPIAWTSLAELHNAGLKLKPEFQDSTKKVKIYDTEVQDGKLKINLLQVEGKRLMDWNSFVNGYAFASAKAPTSDKPAA